MSANRRAPRRAEKLAAGTQATPVPEKAKDTAVLRQLAPVAKKANALLASAEKMTAKADDDLLSAAQLIARAEATCKEAGIKFKPWVETNIDKSWDYTVRLVKAGKADNPGHLGVVGLWSLTRADRASKGVSSLRRAPSWSPPSPAA